MQGFSLKKNAHSEVSLKNSFRRRFVKINLENQSKEEIKDLAPGEYHQSHEEQAIALVVNSSFTMAKEITLAITLKMPDCSIMYAPGLEVAKWILKRRKINLVVASATLPDGSITNLIPVCESLNPPPDLVVVGAEDLNTLEGDDQSQNFYSSITYFGEGLEPVRSRAQKTIVHGEVLNLENLKDKKVSQQPHDPFKKLGADIRNDINNPLQEIVSMVFVAKAGRELSPITLQALEAIDRAAKGLATTVNTLEDRIRDEIS